MPTDATVNNLVINKLTKAQYDAILSPSDTEIYLVPDEIDTTPTSGSDNLVTSGGVYTALSGKQDSLSSQTAYTSKGSSTKVPQITTNSLGQVTGITEVTITQPDVSNFISTSNTTGLVKNDGTIDTNDYLVDEDVFEDIDANGHDYVDLGLPSGTLWATMNVGASTASDYGNYYMWGITTPYDETDTLYNGTEHYLDSTNDVASLEWGGTWHTPTVEQLTELVQYTTYERGSDGTSKYIHKYDSTKYIIIPHAGLYSTSQLASSDPSSSGINGNAWLWSNTGYPEDSSGTVKYSLSIGSLCAVLPKSYGISIRPVLDNKRVKNQTSSNYVKPSWNQTLTSAPDFIVGKPSISSLNSINGASPILCSSSTSWYYDTMGIKYSSSNGTTSALGNAILTLGNVTASGTAGNKYGKLSLYDTGTHTVTLVSSVLGTNRTLNLPNEDGTIATQSYVTSHLPATMVASGSNHAGGLVPDPGSTQGTTKYLREDGTWQVPTNTTYSATDFDIKDLTDSTSLRSTWSGKQDALVSGTNIKTINNQSLLGNGNITISGGGGGGSVDTITNNEIDSIWNRIINGIISFTIDDVSYQAGVNMTWAAWVESDYNTGDFYVNESNEIFTTGSQQVVGVVDTDVIEENGSYTLTTIFD